MEDQLLNGRPNAGISVTQNWKTRGGEGVHNDRPVGVLDEGAAGSWFVYNENGARMPEWASFNVAASASGKNTR